MKKKKKNKQKKNKKKKLSRHQIRPRNGDVLQQMTER